MNTIKGRQPMYYVKNSPESKRFNIIMTVVLAVVVVCLAITFLNIFVYHRIEVDGTSMKNTLQHGDIVYVNVKETTPVRDKVVVIKDVIDDWIIKRVIGLEGDIIEIIDGKVYRKEQGKERVMLSNYGHDYTYTQGNKQGVKVWYVGENQVFYLGDNRSPFGSSDSRTFGMCKTEQIVGVVADWSITIKEVSNVFYRGITLPIKNLFGILTNAK